MYSICSICSSPGIFTSPQHPTTTDRPRQRSRQACEALLRVADHLGSSEWEIHGNPYWWYLLLVCICNILHMYIFMFIIYIYIYHEYNEWHVLYCNIIFMYKCISYSYVCVRLQKAMVYCKFIRCSMIERDKAWKHTHTHTKKHTGHNTGCKLIHGFHGWKNRCLQRRLLVSLHV